MAHQERCWPVIQRGAPRVRLCCTRRLARALSCSFKSSFPKVVRPQATVEASRGRCNSRRCMALLPFSAIRRTGSMDGFWGIGLGAKKGTICGLGGTWRITHGQRPSPNNHGSIGFPLLSRVEAPWEQSQGPEPLNSDFLTMFKSWLEQQIPMRRCWRLILVMTTESPCWEPRW